MAHAYSSRRRQGNGGLRSDPLTFSECVLCLAYLRNGSLEKVNNNTKTTARAKVDNIIVLDKI